MAVQSIEIQRTFRRSRTLLAAFFHPAFLLGVFFDPEEDKMLL
jgi:hypothetical protein